MYLVHAAPLNGPNFCFAMYRCCMGQSGPMVVIRFYAFQLNIGSGMTMFAAPSLDAFIGDHMTKSITQGLLNSAAEDPFLWLEDRTGEQALDWVYRQNAVTSGELQGDPSYQASFETVLDLMTAEDNIAVGAALNGHVYNFWQDKANVLGLWRRTTVASYKAEKPD